MTMIADSLQAHVQTAVLSVLTSGPMTTVQDGGRYGYSHYGVTTSGPLDRESFAMANRLVGNQDGQAALELTLGGFSCVLDAGRWASLTGAPAQVTIDSAPVPDPYLFWVPARSTLEVAAPKIGLRSYLAISGGLQGTPVLGSLSTDTLSGIGPAVIRDGATIAVSPPQTPVWDTDSVFCRIPVGTAEVRFLWGPRDGLFSPADKEILTASSWTVSTETNRVGARLTGHRLDCQFGSLPSEGTALGSIQIPPSGEPIVFLADRPVTGGYPVIGVLTEPDIGYLAQARPGSKIRFTAIN